VGAKADGREEIAEDRSGGAVVTTKHARRRIARVGGSVGIAFVESDRDVMIGKPQHGKR
jgi:hypothetical protein